MVLLDVERVDYVCHSLHVSGKITLLDRLNADYLTEIGVYMIDF